MRGCRSSGGAVTVALLCLVVLSTMLQLGGYTVGLRGCVILGAALGALGRALGPGIGPGLCRCPIGKMGAAATLVYQPCREPCRKLEVAGAYSLPPAVYDTNVRPLCGVGGFYLSISLANPCATEV